MFTSVVVVLLLTTLSVADDVQVPQHPFRVVCHMSFEDDNIFSILDAEPALPMCTHLVYNYLYLNGTSFTVYSRNATRDFDEEGIKRMVSFKNKFPYLTTMIGVGGPDGRTEHYSKMASLPETRSTFVDSVVTFVLDHGLDGMDFYWPKPGEHPGDKPNFVLVVKELRQQFDKHYLILSLTLTGYLLSACWGLDPSALAEHAHFFNLLTFYGPADSSEIVAQSPARSKDTFDYWTTLTFYVRSGIPPHKINFGISNQVIGYLLADGNTTGNFTGMHYIDHRFLDGGRFCKLKEEEGGLVEQWDDFSETPFFRKEELVVSHENARSIGVKVLDAIVSWGLGGIAYNWLESDDFKGDCAASGGKYPMLRDIDKSLVNYADEAYAVTYKSTENYNARYFWNGENKTIWSEDEMYMGWIEN